MRGVNLFLLYPGLYVLGYFLPSLRGLSREGQSLASPLARRGGARDDSLLEEDEKSVLSPIQSFCATRRSWPVMSFGCGMPNIPRIVGEMSRREPFGLSVIFLSFSAITMNGTGFVVCAV